MPKAMILAAGLGTRLLPHTATLPKALVPLSGKPLIAHVLERLTKFGFTEIVVNLHHHSRMLREYLEKRHCCTCKISFSDESEALLDTGGGIRKAAWFFDDGEPFLVHNCDVISLIALDEMFEVHKKNKALATLAVSRRPTSRPLAFDESGSLSGRWVPRRAEQIRPLAFSGVYVLSPGIFFHMPAGGAFSIIDVLLQASKNDKVQAYEHDPEIWADAGNTGNFAIAEALLKNIEP